jgi:hypothetical protein
MLTQVVTDVGDHQLGAPTPCRGATVADLLDHVDGFCVAFVAAAAKDPDAGSQAPSADGSRLGTDWQTRIPDRLAQLAAAWQDERAWTGMTRAGGQAARTDRARKKPTAPYRSTWRMSRLDLMRPASVARRALHGPSEAERRCPHATGGGYGAARPSG